MSSVRHHEPFSKWHITCKICKRMCTCMRACTCICMCIFTCTCICTCTCTYIYMYMCVSVYACVCVCVCVMQSKQPVPATQDGLSFYPKFLCTCVCARARACTRARTSFCEWFFSRNDNFASTRILLLLFHIFLLVCHGQASQVSMHA